jgi:hypothetical protein
MQSVWGELSCADLVLVFTFILLFVSVARFSGRISDSRLVWDNMKLHSGGDLFTNRVIVRIVSFYPRQRQSSVTSLVLYSSEQVLVQRAGILREGDNVSTTLILPVEGSEFAYDFHSDSTSTNSRPGYLEEMHQDVH